MKRFLLLVAGVSLLGLSGMVYADDHHFQATVSGGLIFDPVLGVAVNKSGKVIPEAPGQGSPFTGHDQCTPATDTEAAHEHANVKPKGADDIEDCEE
jgi:hypothetical protein